MSEEDDGIDLLGGSNGDEASDDESHDAERDKPEVSDADEPDGAGGSPDDLDTFPAGPDERGATNDAEGGPRERIDEPLGDLAERLNREDREALEAGESAFEEVDTGEVNIEDVWERLEAGPGPHGEALDEEEDVRRIPRSVCHDCPHFGDPPKLHCTYEGTTIREMPDSEHFVVVECPVVAGEEDI